MTRSPHGASPLGGTSQALEEQREMTQPKDGEGAEALLAIAQIIDPIAFKSHASMLAYCLRTGDAPELAKRYADETHGPDMEKARIKAGAILALAPPATPVRGGGNQELSVSQSQPCGEASADAEVFAGLDVERAAAGMNDYQKLTVGRGRRLAEDMQSCGDLETALNGDLVHQLCDALEAAMSAHPHLWPLSLEEAESIRARGGDPEFRARLLRREHLGPDFLRGYDGDALEAPR